MELKHCYESCGVSNGLTKITLLIVWFWFQTGTAVSDKRGRNFVLSFLPTNGNDGAIRLVVNALYDTIVNVENEFLNISNEYDIKANESFEIGLSPGIRYRNHLEIERKAVIVNSTQDIVLYVFNIDGRSSDGYAALPVQALSTRYLVAAYEKSNVISSQMQSLSAFTIAAVRDNTTVTIRFKNPVSSCGAQESVPVENALAALLRQFNLPGFTAAKKEDSGTKTKTFVLQKYDVIGTNCTRDPTGTVITSNYPVSVVSGGVCSFVPHMMIPECGHMEEMMVPSKQFGLHYALHELEGRPSGAIYRIIANENNTKISSNLGESGVLHETQSADINIKETGALCLHASKPVLVVMYAKGSHADYPESYGGPFMTIVPPTERLSQMPIHLSHIQNMSFAKEDMTLYVSVVQKQECKDSFDHFDEVRSIPKCGFGVATLKLRDQITNLVRVPEIPYSALIYGFGTGDGFGFSLGASFEETAVDTPVTRYCSSYPCLNQGKCEEGCPFTCQCPDGFLGRQCEKQKNNTMEPAFRDTDNCISNPCVHGTCRDRIDTYKCVCQRGFNGNNCELYIDDCLGDPCVHGSCKDGLDSYTCSCHPGFSGKQCDIDIDDCSPDPCWGHGECRDGINNYTCLCQPGFVGNNCRTDLDECSSQPCFHNSTCVDGANTYSCICEEGYTGTRCENDIVECMSSPCKNGGYCQEGSGFYMCVCPPGYTGINCQADIDECSPQPCLHNGTCTDLVNAFKCDCLPGYTGHTCDIDIDECTSNPCDHNGTCNDLLNGFTCDCAAGFTGSLCQTDIDDCVDNVCQNNSPCVDGINKFFCNCSTGFQGQYCQRVIESTTTLPPSNTVESTLVSMTRSTITATTTTTESVTSTATSTFSLRGNLARRNRTYFQRKRVVNLSYAANIGMYSKARFTTVMDSRLSSVIIGCCALGIMVCACTCICVHDSMVHFWTPRRRVAAETLLRRHGLQDPSPRYTVPTVIRVNENTPVTILQVQETNT